jgi:hypothetical protein
MDGDSGRAGTIQAAAREVAITLADQQSIEATIHRLGLSQSFSAHDL